MTLVQTLLTPTGVLQVSDRQLTFPSGEASESPANKAVVWCEHMVVGFSGIAFTDSAGKCTVSEWIVEKLRGARTVEDATQSLVLGGNELMADREDDQLRKLTMILAGALRQALIAIYSIASLTSHIRRNQRNAIFT